ncbi:hypothetical protein SCP_0112790 [Sparassis crispa]|uniref:Uncharacterized protein n=1 Tax=Sparassis crispa TaxID=139825 RepID=A0A401G8A5_9APHY|nr:hypothetical protein SCP_0112790 [Sparassis crispa]GBE78394.1 hypothetical protein SCP_0112790 [Sparassis crispa]
MASDLPPFYVLQASGPALVHPAVEYHYADDDPRALLPRRPGEQLLVLDYRPPSAAPPSAQSLSPLLAVTALRVIPAPGAALADDARNPNLYIIHTTSPDDDHRADDDEDPSPQAVLARFKQRNAVLRRALDYSDASIHPKPLSAAPPCLSPPPHSR